MRFRKNLLLVVPLYLFVSFLLFPLLSLTSAEAADITVTTTSDEFNNTPNGTCSLREAVQSANIDANFGGCSGSGSYGADTILLPDNTYLLTISCNGNEEADVGNDNSCGDIDILDTGDPTTIQGNAASPDQVIVQGRCNIQNVGTENCECSSTSDIERIFHVGPSGNSNSAIAVTANFQGFTITRGYSDDNGGGIRLNETSTANIDLMIFDENVTANRGGAITSEGEDNGQAFLTISRSLFSDNCSSNRGGALAVRGTVAEIYKSEFFNNFASDSGAAITTEGVNNTNASTLIENTTFTQNLTVNQGTVNNENDGATTEIINSTLIGNRANGGSVAGVNRSGSAGAVEIENTVIGLNTSNNGGSVNDCSTGGSQSITSNGDNAISDNTCAGSGGSCLVPQADGDKTDCTSAQLFPGGIPSLTSSPATPARFLRPTAGSVLIDMGDNAACAATGTTLFDGTNITGEDQQCCPRDFSTQNSCDIGAVQADISYPGCLAPPPPNWCCNNNSAQGGDGQCVPAPNGAQNCNGAALTFFEDGVNGIVLAPLGPPPLPQAGDLCPNPQPQRETCMCVDGNGAIIPCQDLPPPPTDPPPTNPPPTNPPPTNPPPTNPPPTDPPPTNPPPTDPPPTNPPPTDPPPTNPPPTDPPPTNPPPTDPPPTDPPPTDPPPTNPPPTDPPPTNPPPTDPPPTDPPPTDPPPTDPPPTDPPPTDPPPTDPPPTDPPPTDPPPSLTPEVGCCVESEGVCSIESAEVCTVPPNLEFLGVGSTCTNEPRCVPPPTDPPPTNPPPTESPALGCCVEAEGLCGVTTQSNCSVPPNQDFMGIGTDCENVSACNLPPPPPTEVPTMSEWGLIATAIMLGLFSLITVRRGFRINNK